MARNAWLVRSGVDNELIAQVEREGFVAVGAGNLSDLRRFTSRRELLSEYQKRNPEESAGQVYLRGGQLWKIAREIEAGDIVLTPKRATRELLMGIIVGQYQFAPKRLPDYPHTRLVSWTRKIGRDRLKPALRNSAGGISTVFSLTRFLPDLEALLR